MSGRVATAAVHGTGRMAGAVVQAASAHPRVNVGAIIGRSRPDWDWFGEWCEHFEDIDSLPDLLIDFSLPDGTMAAAEWCAQHGVPLVSGVTGLDDRVVAALESAGQLTPVLWAPNLSLGVSLLARLASQAARVASTGVSVRIEDVHHQWKKDAPSGTALMLARVIEEQMSPGAGHVKIESTREGEVIGDHRITFGFPGETIELVHRAEDRAIFASGALDAGAWLLRQPPGLYSAANWLEGLLGD